MLNRQKFLRFFKHNSRGFSLIEVVIAICLLGIIGVGLLSGLATASLALFTADERATAESLARSQMEYVKSQPYNTDNGTYETIDLTDFPTYTTYTVYGYNKTAPTLFARCWDPVSGSVSANETGIQWITVTIEHHGKPITTSGDYTLEGYKVNR